LNVTFDDAGNITEATGEPVIMDAARTEGMKRPPVSAHRRSCRALQKKIRNKLLWPKTSEAIDGERDNCRTKESGWVTCIGRDA
jgi:5'-nucleotidase